jgi:hypothetical protein
MPEKAKSAQKVYGENPPFDKGIFEPFSHKSSGPKKIGPPPPGFV